MVKAVGPGTVTVTATAIDGTEVKDTIEITVTDGTENIESEETIACL